MATLTDILATEESRAKVQVVWLVSRVPSPATLTEVEGKEGPHPRGEPVWLSVTADPVVGRTVAVLRADFPDPKADGMDVPITGVALVTTEHDLMALAEFRPELKRGGDITGVELTLTVQRIV